MMLQFTGLQRISHNFVTEQQKGVLFVYVNCAKISQADLCNSNTNRKFSFLLLSCESSLQPLLVLCQD